MTLQLGPMRRLYQLMKSYTQDNSRYKGGKRNNTRVNPPSLRKNVVNHEIQDNVWFQVYWKVLELGRGPAVILYIFDIAVLKFDCFGKDKGHYHVDMYKLGGLNGVREKRVFLHEDTALKQIDRAVFELRTNLRFYLQHNPDVRIRNIEIDRKRFESALARVRLNMIKFLETVPELEGN